MARGSNSDPASIDLHTGLSRNNLYHLYLNISQLMRLKVGDRGETCCAYAKEQHGFNCQQREVCLCDSSKAKRRARSLINKQLFRSPHLNLWAADKRKRDRQMSSDQSGQTQNLLRPLLYFSQPLTNLLSYVTKMKINYESTVLHLVTALNLLHENTLYEHLKKGIK